MNVEDLIGSDERPVALLVEDETLVAMIAEEVLGELGFRAVHASDAASALAVLKAAPPPALALVDVGLPDMRGDQLTVRMRTLAPNMKIVIATGYDEASLKLAFGEDAMIRILSKPYSETDLALAIRSLGLAVADQT